MSEVNNDTVNALEPTAAPHPGGGPGVPPQGLTLTDLRVVASIIETCCERGAFQAQEMTPVGNTYNKIVAFIASQAPPPTPPVSPQADAEQQTEAKE